MCIRRMLAGESITKESSEQSEWREFEDVIRE